MRGLGSGVVGAGGVVPGAGARGGRGGGQRERAPRAWRRRVYQDRDRYPGTAGSDNSFLTALGERRPGQFIQVRRARTAAISHRRLWRPSRSTYRLRHADHRCWCCRRFLACCRSGRRLAPGRAHGGASDGRAALDSVRISNPKDGNL